MPVLSKGSLSVDCSDDGQGHAVVLIHSSVSGNRQWRALVDALKDRCRVLAINLYGYGETTKWPEGLPQSLYAQAQLVLALCEEVGKPVSLVGHSFGGSVAVRPTSRRARCVIMSSALVRSVTGISLPSALWRMVASTNLIGSASQYPARQLRLMSELQ